MNPIEEPSPSPGHMSVICASFGSSISGHRGGSQHDTSISVSPYKGDANVRVEPQDIFGVPLRVICIDLSSIAMETMAHLRWSTHSGNGPQLLSVQPFCFVF